jgi:hypothetical protein
MSIGRTWDSFTSICPPWKTINTTTIAYIKNPWLNCFKFQIDQCGTCMPYGIKGLKNIKRLWTWRIELKENWRKGICNKNLNTNIVIFPSHNWLFQTISIFKNQPWVLGGLGILSHPFGPPSKTIDVTTIAYNKYQWWFDWISKPIIEDLMFFDIKNYMR